MTTPTETSGEGSSDGCAELRVSVEARCRDAHAAKTTYEESSELVKTLRRDLVAAQHRETEAVAADDHDARTAQKSAARDAYRLAMTTAETDEELAEVAATWARTLDRINRSSRLAKRAVTKAGTAVSEVETALHEAERDEQTQRIQAEQAESACLDARVLLAACEEGPAAPEGQDADVFEPHAATGGHAVTVSEIGGGVPLVIESMVSGDRRALDLAAAQVAEETGLSPAESQLQLQELVDAIVSTAADEGFLVFDPNHPFWSTLSFEEARDVIGALGRLGFQFEPAEGWHAGRSPTPADLSMALAYAGLDARNMRDLPGADDLRLLPHSIGVDARAFLAARASDLAVDHLVRLLDRRASQLEPLWDSWGQVRPILLSDRHALGSVPG